MTTGMRRGLVSIGVILGTILLAGCGPIREYAASRKAENLLAEGWQALLQEDKEKASLFFHEAIRLRPAGDVFARIGLAYHLCGYFREALPWLKKAFAMDSHQPWPAKVALAAGYAASGQPEQARPHIQDALLHLPDDPFLLNNLAYPLADAGLLLEEVTLILEKAVEKAPRNGVILDSLGWAYFRQGHAEEALPILEQAARLAPHEEIRRHLAEVRRTLKGEEKPWRNEEPKWKGNGREQKGTKRARKKASPSPN